MKSNSSESKKTLTPEMEFSEKLTFRDYLIATEQKANQPLPIWRLIAPLLLQVGLIMAVPGQALYTDVAGKSVILQSLPVNRNDLLRSYSLTLNYNISRLQTLRRLPGWREWVNRNTLRNRQISPGSTLYLILQERFSGNQGVPTAWRPIRVSSDRPTSLSNNQVALKGNYQDGFINYGLDNYYIPDEQRQRINNELQSQPTRNGRVSGIIVQLKVDPQGNAVPVSLWIRDNRSRGGYRNYRF
ncbi:GDYXXLXY domain-containing protein [Cronbergia sp. UHCC 0137]|uniref:GDYXXLXY domain-containing protein n=1 Tax=Cronbergia sp. UHCC 0137 TaxID=3110239 RepID=UPI002B21275D|nr:GDYXXLXY domain-containing protein [Cronbergia sp. UHCC 0137]MEA5619048.1 GDYXXLXY domain-containing protein [Cronbergia sp. UHCC 0137]